MLDWIVAVAPLAAAFWVGWLVARRFGIGRRVQATHLETGRAPPAGEIGGTLRTYFSKIEELEAAGLYDSFFVTASLDGSDRFVQVSAGAGDGGWDYMFDIPVVAWSEPYITQIEAEARRRGHSPVRRDAGMVFLDVDDLSREAHEDFSRWVVSQVFGIPDDAQFSVTWG